uniref:CSON003486 protein n=1 Tax=Culicoides sonorensis TaxID=179676 RepID=A0A336MNK9_CULSO
MPEVLALSPDQEPDLSTFENKSGLAEDMKFLASMPELCDVTFLVGETREPVCAVKAVLAARSRVFQKMLYQTPSPQQRKKEPAPRENKLRLFLKRSSEPLLNLQNAAQQGQQHQTLIIEEFEPDVFRQLIEYIHTGCVTLQPRTLLGVMNAADYYGLEELRRSCAGFVQCCINVDTVCALLASAERYIQYKCTKTLVQKVLEFVDEHGNEVLNLGSFTLLPQHVVRLILVREELRADEFTKFQAALMWSKKYCDSNPTPLKEVIGNFLEYIQFHKIPANVLMREVHPLGIVPYSIIMNALAYQADPASVDPGKLSPNSSRVRRARASQGRSMSVQSSLDPMGSNTTLSSSGSSDPASSGPPNSTKSQSFRTHRRSPSERKSPSNLSQGPWNTSNEKRRSPGSLSATDKSPGSFSQKSPSTLSRQGTMKQSMHKRKNSLSASLNLNQGRRSPQSILLHSPQGRKSPNYLTHDQMRSPDRRSPTSGTRRSPLGFYQPSLTPTEKLSPSGHPYNSGRRTPTNLNFGMTSPISSIAELKSPMGPIPPITISNPSETYPIIQKTMPSQPEKPSTSPKSASPARETPPPENASEKTPEKKEKQSVMKEILNFVRKPSKRVTTQTSKFAAAFTRRESGSGSPLMRQSTFSSIPNTSSRAGRNAITKQISEVGFEPKMSLKLKSVGSKMSLRLRRFDKDKDNKKSSGDEISAGETSDSGKIDSIVNDSPDVFEMDKVRFEKVGELYKHEHISEEGQSPKPGGSMEAQENDSNNLTAKIENVYAELKKSLETIMDKTNAGLEGAVGGQQQQQQQQEKTGNTITCEIQIEPPSRRASFDPPRSPYLENLRSLSSTDHSRVDSGGESFELVDSDRYRESSFEDRCSSMSSSFNISRYQSTSYEDPTSSFEIVEGQEGKKSPYDVRKSSIELVDAETFARSSPKGRKSSLETHFDLADNYKSNTTTPKNCPSGPKQLTCNTKEVKKHYHHHQRARSPLSYQTSSNYSSRDSYDSNMDPMNHTRQHYVVQKSPNGPNAALLCTDKRCAQIFEPRPARTQSPFLGPQDTSSGSEFEPPSPRRAASASPKHTFTFRIVLKKVESSPDDICPSTERRSRDRVDRHRRRDSRKKRLFETGKSF